MQFNGRWVYLHNSQVAIGQSSRDWFFKAKKILQLETCVLSSYYNLSTSEFRLKQNIQMKIDVLPWNSFPIIRQTCVVL